MSWGKQQEPTRGLHGHRVLVVDDESVIALDLELILTGAGATVVGPAATVADGLALAICETLSAAVLDVRLGNETIAPVATALADRGTPMLFYSGQLESDAMLRRWPKSAFLAKPASARSLLAAVRKLVDEAGDLRRRGRPAAFAGPIS